MGKSIRLRLALSFAAIALVTATVLGVVLLVILQRYYTNLEFDYLWRNANFIASLVAATPSDKTSHDEMQSQIESLGFLMQTQIQVNDANGQLLYDSGSPQGVNVSLGSVTSGAVSASPIRLIAINVNAPGKLPSLSDPVPGEPPPLDNQTPDEPSVGGTKNVTFYRSFRGAGSLFGFDANAETASSDAHSPLHVKQAVTDPKNGASLGTVELTQGPALGRDILNSVARGWIAASAVAVLIAAGAGWFISRRISAPVLALTATTNRMAAGDLSSRAAVNTQDEFGHLARSFNEMADQVEGTIATLRRFVSDAAHELLTPVTALRTNLDLVADDQNAEERALFLQRAQQTVQRLAELNNNLLDLSRLEAKATTTVDTTIDLANLVKRRSEFYASQAEQAGLIYRAETPAEPVLVRADATQVTRAIDNLMDNACKFTPAGGSVRIQLESDAHRVMLSVADSGIGIPAEDLPQLFNRFHRGRNATAYAGSGLGLAIVNTIVNQQGGDVSAMNLNPGACFTLAWNT